MGFCCVGYLFLVFFYFGIVRVGRRAFGFRGIRLFEGIIFVFEGFDGVMERY